MSPRSGSVKRIPRDAVIDDALLARLRAERDRTADAAERRTYDAALEALAECRGMTFGQAYADTEAKTQDAQKNLNKADAVYATALGGYFRPASPVPGSYNVFRAGASAAAVSAAPTPASQVLDRHAQLHDTLARPGRQLTGLISWYGEWADRGYEPGTQPETGEAHPSDWMIRYMLYPYKVGGQRPRADWEAKFLAWVARGLFMADTYQVTTPMCEIAEAMYEQTAKVNGHIEAADLPSETGFLWLDKPFIRRDAKGETYGTRVVTWQPQSLRRDGGSPEDGVRITLWGDREDDPDIAASARRNPETLGELGPLLMVMSVVVPFGADFGSESDEGVPMPLHYVHAVWMLAGIEVAATDRGEVNRATRKRALRSIRHNQVTVITLRRGRHDDDREAGHADIDWSCRWLVRGFWRHRWGYGTIGHPHNGQPRPDGLCVACGARITWVRPYVKGPDDRPLKATRTLYRLSRLPAETIVSRHPVIPRSVHGEHLRLNAVGR